MKAIKDKFVVCNRNDHGESDIGIVSIDRRKNKIPTIFNCPADAVIEIGNNMVWLGECVNRKEIDEEALNIPFSYFVARFDRDKDGQVLIESLDGEEIIYDGHYNGLVK